MIMDYYEDFPDADEEAIKLANEEAYESDNDSVKIVEGKDGQLSFDDFQTEDEEAYDKPQEPIRNILAHDLHVVINNEPTTLHGKADYIFVDIFDAIDFDLSKPNGRAIVTTLNGGTPDYMQPINEGDKIEVYWRNQANIYKYKLSTLENLGQRAFQNYVRIIIVLQMNERYGLFL